MKIQPDDPRLTAFALGELEGEEHAWVAAAVAADPALQAVVEEIGGAVAQLTAALAAEPAPAVAPIELPGSFPVTEAPRRARRVTRGARIFQFPYVAIGSLAAACFAIVFLIHNQTEHAFNETARRVEAEKATHREQLAVTLNPPPAGSIPPASLMPDTLPPIASDSSGTLVTPPPFDADSSVPMPAMATGPATTVAVAPTLPASPNTTPVPVLQTPVTAQRASAGLAHDASAERGSTPTGLPLLPPASSPPVMRSLVAQGSLPPLPSGAGAEGALSGEVAGGHYAELFADDVVTSDHLRLTFRDFGTPRYATNRTTPAPGSSAGTEGSVGFAGNSSTSEDIATAEEAGATGRPQEENLKVTAPRRLRIPYEQPVGGVAALEEAHRRGTIDPAAGGQIADLETQLRELQATDGSLDSPVQDFVRDNAFVATTDHPASVFPVVIDAASHVNVRRALLAGTRPARDTVRIEELLNAHTYDYAAPVAGSAAPFAAALESAAAPWAPQHRLVRVGLKARDLAPTTRPAGHFVVLVETSESTDESSQLPLIKSALREFVAQLGPRDEIAIAQHAMAASLVLPSTPVRDRAAILGAIDQLRPHGAAAGATGLQLAYDIARSHYVADGINRVVLLTDGDARLGETGRDTALRLIDDQARVGISLSAVGFGVRNIRDSMLESMAHRGRGEFTFVDQPRDAQRALADRAGTGFITVARNVKVQVEFNPTRVQSWRLIGYEDRVFLREDFDHESLAADAVGAGHTVTALFEIVPIAQPAPSVDDTVAINAEMLTVKVRYHAPGSDAAQVQQFSLTDSGREFVDASDDFRFAAAVAGFGMILRESPHRGTATLADVSTWARTGLGADRDGLRTEFIELIDRAGRVVR